jgi:hypothetical protein
VFFTLQGISNVRTSVADGASETWQQAYNTGGMTDKELATIYADPALYEPKTMFYENGQWVSWDTAFSGVL